MLFRSCWKITEQGETVFKENQLAKNAIKQRQALQSLMQSPIGIPHDRLSSYGLSLTTLKTLAGKKWVIRDYQSTSDNEQPLSVNLPDDIQLNPDQSNAIDAVCGELNQFKTWLLFGVTASGKTEVYLRVIEQVISQGKQALVLVPEIGLTPQTVSRFQKRFNTVIERSEERRVGKEC